MLARWLSRDPIGERGGPGLYLFLKNDGVNGIDYLGMKAVSYLFACGPSGGTAALISAPAIMKRKISGYTAPANAACKCSLKININTSSTYVKNATTIYDKIFFAGHGVLHTEQREDWKLGDSLLTRDIKRTKVVFSDGNKFWKDLLSGDNKDVVTTVIIPLVCYDAYCDRDNELGINVLPAIGNTEKNSIAWIAPFMDNLIKQFETENCKTIEITE